MRTPRDCFPRESGDPELQSALDPRLREGSKLGGTGFKKKAGGGDQ
jgi:hypothetical protein